jgi:hypothetical protein
MSSFLKYTRRCGKKCANASHYKLIELLDKYDIYYIWGHDDDDEHNEEEERLIMEDQQEQLIDKDEFDCDSSINILEVKIKLFSTRCNKNIINKL